MLIVWLAGCLGLGGECGPEECAEVVEAVNGSTSARTPFERGLVQPLLQDIRAGVRPWDEEGVGVCRGARTCEEFLGTDPGELPAGEYLVRAKLAVPSAGAPGTWTVRFETECEVEGQSVVPYNRTYEVVAPGGGNPFRIGALRRITSPNGQGAESCTWKLVAPHPDGEKVFTGSWNTPPP